MNLPTAVNVLRWLIWDTFCQSLASRIFWIVLTISALAIAFCASVSVRGGTAPRDPRHATEFVRPGEAERKTAERDGVNVIEGELVLGFGAVRVPHARDAEDSVHFLQLILAGAVAGTLGILMSLIWTAGFLPSFLEPQSASVMLTKPAPRWLILLGKFIGMTLFVGLHATIFVVGTWLLLGITTGIWTQAYLASVPLLMLQFAFFYSVSMFLAVATRSTIACIIGSILFWLLCTAVNSARIEALMEPETSGMMRWPIEIAYWVLPKPLDFNLLVGQALGAQHYFATWPAAQAMMTEGRFLPELSILSSAAFAGVTVLAASLNVRKTEY